MRRTTVTLSATLTVLLASLCTLGIGAAQVAPPQENLIAGGASGPWRRLFLDAMVVESQQGLQRVFHAAEKYPGNPVIPRTKPWEGTADRSGPYLYGTVMWDDGLLKMWYHAYTSGAYYNLYATSNDGIQWEKPNLGIIDFEGSKDNNLFLTVSTDVENPQLYKGGGKCHNPSVIKRPWEPDPEKRWALFCYSQEYRHSRVAFSPDGLRWTFVPETVEKALFSSSDVLNYFWDTYQNRYACTWKSGNRRGRAVGIVTSKDGLSWTKPVEGPVFVADDLDPDATQIYGMPVFPYQGLYIGMPWIYNARWFKYGGYTDQRLYESEADSPCTMDVQLAWSWDLINWTRPPGRKQFIARGEEGRFDSDMIYTARAPVQVGDELYFYYGGWNKPHNNLKALSAIGLAKLRLDGFCSMRAGEQEGRLISRREPMHVAKVTINAKTSPDGYVLAELLDKHNNVIEGFSREDCVPFTGDSVDHVLTWSRPALPEEMVEEDKKIRFWLKNADLYSYLPDQTTGPVFVTYVPGDNGGLLADDPKIPPRQRFARNGDPAGYKIATEGDLLYVDLHSVAARQTDAAYWRDVTWKDDTDWCMEAWYRVVDVGTEPNYGLATFVRPDAGRNVALYLSDRQVGFLSTDPPHDHKTLKTFDMDTTDDFHWYRMVHSGGKEGQVTLFVDGKQVLSMPYADLYMRSGRGYNVGFGPNASSREGRMQVAKFGLRVGSTEPIFGPVGE